MSHSVDWRGIAEKLGTIIWTEHGRMESGGGDVGCAAIAAILGDDVLRDAVDFHISGQPGNDIPRSVLIVLKPAAAMERCREISRNHTDEQEAADAINLLKMIADRRVLEWIPEFMESDNVGVRVWTVGIVDQLLIMQDAITPEEAAPFFRQMLADPSDTVRSQAAHILDEFAENEQVAAVRALLQ